jgi:diaminopimelate decarboxylase
MTCEPRHALTESDGRLCVEEVPLRQIAAQFGTPCYIYSAATLRTQYQQLATALTPLNARIHYSVKANSNLSILYLFKELGAGFDIVSGGELSRVLAVGGNPADIIFSGVGKSVAEIDFALKVGIGCFNVESRGELQRIQERAELAQRRASISIRVNPNVDAKTHPYISTGLKSNKFGVDADAALALYKLAATSDALKVEGIDCHIGSQIADDGPLLEALDSILELTDTLEHHNIALEHINLGGGFGVRYKDEEAMNLDAYGARLQERLGARQLPLRVEPGRSLTANAGLLLTQVEYLKQGQDGGKGFAVVDAAMNDLLRPSLYQAWHEVLVVDGKDDEDSSQRWDVVGPICESGDFLAQDRQLNLNDDSLIAVLSAGAYGMSLASNYNTRGRAAEVLVDGAKVKCIRRRETIQDQLRLELPL